MKDELSEVRLRLARLEGAAKRLLDLLGCPADGRKGPDGTLEALRRAAAAAESGTGVRECRGIGVDRESENGPGKRWEF